MGKRPRLMLAEARRALYLDFEGRRGEKPAVLGTLWSPNGGAKIASRQYLLDPRLASAKLPGAGTTSLQGELGSLLRRCRKENRLLVGWSTHEVKKVKEWAPELADDFDELFRDAKAVAKIWRLRLHPELAQGGSHGDRRTVLSWMQRGLGVSWMSGRPHRRG